MVKKYSNNGFDTDSQLIKLFDSMTEDLKKYPEISNKKLDAL